MSHPYTKRILEVASGNGTYLAVVPAGKVWIVTNLTVAQSSFTAATSYIFLRQGGAAFLLGGIPANANYNLQWAGKVVLNAGETLQATLTSAQGIHVHVAAYELDAT